MQGDSFILHQTNSLARKFYFALGLRTSGHAEFWDSEDELMQLCWTMAKLAQMDLAGIDADKYIPEPKTIKLISVIDRISAARQDGKVTARHTIHGN